MFSFSSSQRNEVQSEKSDSLRLKSHIVVSLIEYLIGSRSIEPRFGLPLEFLLSPSIHVFVVTEGSLSDMNIVELNLATVSVIPNSLGKSRDVEIVSLRFDRAIENVSNILQSKQDRVLGHRNHMELEGSVFSLTGVKLGSSSEISPVILLRERLIHGKEVLKRLINNLLNISLGRFGCLIVEKLDAVCCSNSHTLALRVLLIKVLIDSTVVIVEKSSVLHKLNATTLDR
mmetsp:Transcript_117533/g.163645  ORF Transcript_117533/g.163645 Transcript_117533/m.163645 type:complete len:230 (-) Transcript_117533:2504-3193(-)